VFAEANGLSPDPPDPGLVKTESSMLEHLADGKFYYPATIDAPLLSILVNDAMRKASNELALAKDRELRFIPRTTQCGKSQGSGRGSARIARAVNPDAYFPPAALRRDEEGSIVLRARIAPTNCATHVAIVASSGYPVLDEAAIKVFEATTFQAAVDEDGKPKESEFTFKVMFALRRPSR
jgi:TonB family protein